MNFIRLGYPTHYVKPDGRLACGVVGKSFAFSSNLSEVDCLRCRKTKAFRAKRLALAAVLAAAANGAGSWDTWDYAWLGLRPLFNVMGVVDQWQAGDGVILRRS